MPAFWFKLAIKIAFGTIYISKLLKPQSGKYEFRTIAADISSMTALNWIIEIKL